MCPVSDFSDRFDFIGDECLLSIVLAVFAAELPAPMDDTSVPVMENGVPVPAGVVLSELG